MPGDIVQIGKDFRAKWDMLYARVSCGTIRRRLAFILYQTLKVLIYG